MSILAKPSGRQAVEAVYYAFLLSIPLESVVYIQRDEEGSGGISISRILGALLFALALVNRRVCFQRLPAAFWLCCWYLAAFTLSQLWVPASLDARFHEQQFTLFQMAALFLISLNLFADEEFRGKVLRVFGWAIGLTALGMVLDLFGAEFGVSRETRKTILDQNPNTTAALFAFGSLCVASDPQVLGARRSPWRALAAVAAVGVMVAAIMKTGSRSGLMGLAGGIIALAACGGKTTRGARLAIAVLSLGVLGLLVRREFQNETVMAARLERSWTRGDTSGRTSIYDAAWQMFQERPLLGYGGAYNRFLLGTGLNRQGRGGREADRDTHNVFLAVLTEVGLVGGLPFIAALALALWTGWRSGRRTGDALPFALMVSLMIVNSSGTGFRQKIFWVIVAAAVASAYSRRTA